MARLLADRYELGDEVARGGSARVHVARDRLLDRRVAVKLLDAGVVVGADSPGRDRFLREARSSAGFSHRNAVTVFDAGQDGDDLYLVMELVDGPSLATVIADQGALPIDRSVGIARQVLAALGAAHRAGIVHRDVKPANVVLDRDGEAKLADFGIAKRFDDLEDSVTAHGIVLGTPRYLAPEQAIGEPASPSSDLYGVGLTLFEMLAGEPAFGGEGTASGIEAAAMRAHLPVPDVRSARADVPGPLAEAVSRALAPDPRDRFSSAEQMAAALATAPPRRTAPTQVMPAAAPVRTSARPASSRAPRWLPVALVGIVGLAVLALGVADGDDDPLTAADAASGTTVAVTTVPPTEAAAATTPETTTPATSAATTSPPDPLVGILSQLGPVENLVQLTELFETDPDALGSHGRELTTRMREVIEEPRERPRSDAAEALRGDVARWLEGGELDQHVAEWTDALLAPYVVDDGDGGDDDGGPGRGNGNGRGDGNDGGDD